MGNRQAVFLLGGVVLLATIALFFSLRAGHEASPATGSGDAAGQLAPAHLATAGSTAPAEPSPPPEPELHRAERRMMGTVWAISIAGGDLEAGNAAMTHALDEVARLETVLSEWMPDSEVSLINRNAGKAPVHVSSDVMACMQASLAVARWSDGAFDVSWAVLRDLWDFGPDSRHVPPTPAQVKARLPLWNYHFIKVDEKKSTIFLEKRGMQIGLGGIAKGYAGDRAADILIKAGFNDFLIFAGGQVIVHGKRGSRAWRVGIQHPRDPGSYFGFVEVTDGSVSTSGDYEHSFFYEGQRYHHIIDPKTGFPSDKSASVTLIAKTGLWADAADTAVFIMGPERGLEALATAPGGPFEAVVVAPDLKVSATPGMQERLLLRTHLDAQQRLGEPLPSEAPPERLPGPPAGKPQ